MNKPYLFFCFLLLAFINPPRLIAQVSSNMGYSFWTAFPSHESLLDNNNVKLWPNFSVLITSDRASSGTVSVGGFSKQFAVLPNTVTEVVVPRISAYIDHSDSGKVLPGRGIHVQVDAGMPPVVVYAHIFADRRSAASLVLPEQALGRRYYSINYQQGLLDEGKNYILAIATEPHTRIRIKKGNTELVPGGVLLDAVGDVYEYLSSSDLTGVAVEVDQGDGCSRFALFTGSTGIRIAHSYCWLDAASIDPLFQQNYPIENWGLNYGFVPFSMESPSANKPVRTIGQYVRVLAKDAGTKVYIDGVAVATLNTGEFYTTPNPLRKAALISADKPVCVAQYALSKDCSDLFQPTSKAYGDPDMVLLNPIELNIKNITLYASDKENIKEQYINVLISAAAAPSFRINGQAPAASFTTVPELPGYAYLQLNLNNYNTKVYTLTANAGFNAVAYGFGEVESYAYSAGTNLNASYQLSGIRTGDQQLIDSACVNEDFSFRLTFNHEASEISWQMGENEVPVVQQNPTGKPVVVNGNVAFEYSFPRTATYQHPGLHHNIVTVNYGQNGNCNAGFQQVEYDFLVKAAPVVAFETDHPDCPNEIHFNDLTEAGGLTITARHWDFGDADAPSGQNSSDLKAPTHTFTKEGIYTISLIITYSSGCQSYQIVDLPVAEAIRPQLAFDEPPAVCVSAAKFIITQAKEISGAAGAGYFSGNGVATDGTFDPALAGPGDHQITYTFTSATNCTASITQTLRVLEAPYADNYSVDIKSGESITLTPHYQGQQLVFNWRPEEGITELSDARPRVSPTKTTIYQVTISNPGCTYTASVTVNVLPLPDQPIAPVLIHLPNAFSPNGDGVNDTWVIDKLTLYPNAEVSIFNREGVRLFYSRNAAASWDGTYHQKPVPTGVYYYLINLGPKLPLQKGPLSLLR